MTRPNDVRSALERIMGRPITTPMELHPADDDFAELRDEMAKQKTDTMIIAKRVELEALLGFWDRNRSAPEVHGALNRKAIELTGALARCHVALHYALRFIDQAAARDGVDLPALRVVLLNDLPARIAEIDALFPSPAT